MARRAPVPTCRPEAFSSLEPTHQSDPPGAGHIHTIGHSTRPQAELIGLLRQHLIATLVDIRTIPRSARHPQFNRDALELALPGAGVRYLHEPRLGGLRHATRQDSPNRGWQNPGFRAYADHMLTPEFESALAALRTLALASGPVAIMCAEAVPWRCHRSLVSDALLVRGVEVVHILGAGRSEPHRLTSFACVEGTRITYPEPRPGGAPSPGDQPSLFEE